MAGWKISPPPPPLPTFQNAPLPLLFFAMSNETFHREISGQHHIIFQEQQIKFQRHFTEVRPQVSTNQPYKREV